MAKRNRAAMHIETGRVRTEMLRPGNRHGGEGFVDFIKIDIVNLHASLLQRLLRPRNGGFQHDNRIAADNRHVMDAGKRLDAKRLEAPLIDDHDARRTVADLRGGRRRDGATFGEKLHVLDRLKARIEADTFVNLVDFLRAILERHFHGNDFSIEKTRLRRLDRLLVAVEAKFIKLVLGEAVLLGHHLGAGKLAELDVRVALFNVRALVEAEAVLEWQRDRHANRHARYASDACRDG